MKHCHNCGLSIGDTAAFCATCGTLVPVEAEEAAPSEVATSVSVSAPEAVAPETAAPEAAEPGAAESQGSVSGVVQPAVPPDAAVPEALPPAAVTPEAAPADAEPETAELSGTSPDATAPEAAVAEREVSEPEPAVAEPEAMVPEAAVVELEVVEPEKAAAEPVAVQPGTAVAGPDVVALVTLGAAALEPAAVKPQILEAVIGEAAAAGIEPVVPAVSRDATCRLCGDESPAIDTEGVCPSCRATIALLVAAQPEESLAVSVATGEVADGPGRVTIVNAIYSALADESTCPACAAMDGRETNDAATAAGWAPNPHCANPAGCRCVVFFEHESLSADEERDFVAFAADHGLPVSAATVASFHDERHRRRAEIDRRLDRAADLVREARTLEKSDPQGAVILCRRAIEGFMECSESPLDEYRVRHDLPLAFNRLTLVLKAMGREAEALDEVERAAAWGILDRDDCGRKADREAVKKRGRWLRERLEAAVTA